MKKVLADANIWIHHWRQTNPLLIAMAGDGEILTHPIVIGELSMGNLRNRDRTLWDLTRLGRPPLATDAETLRMVEALQFHEEFGEVCPAGWHKGESGMSATTEGVADYLSNSADKL